MAALFLFARWQVLPVAVVIQVAFVLSARAGEPRLPWQVEWEKTVKAAETEGQVVIYSTDGLDLVFREALQKKFPKIKVTTVTGRGFELGQRIMAERRAGKNIQDLFVMGSTTPVAVLHKGKALDPIRSAFILPEVMDQSAWWQGKHHYVDPESNYVFMFEGTARGGDITFNTNLVKPDEIKSYWDLLNPKWRGKIVALDPLIAGPASNSERFFYYSPELGQEFVRRLFSETDMMIVRNDEQLMDWLAAGKFSLGLFARAVDRAEKQGLPVRQFLPGQFKEGSSVGAYNGTLSFLNRAPNPNAAKVVINWLLSREGQTTWLEYNFKERSDYDSMREDIPKEKVNPRGRRVPGGKYLMTDRPEWMDMKPIYDLIKQATTETKKQ
ncbi:MAG TPA: extracellular solute-binding protein [Candidatus Binatia bacterium]|jgi:iron(III) transport system substrate-binding protein|nr:extracellular solute-binding protein [Candidatus Binatia bacterium]